MDTVYVGDETTAIELDCRADLGAATAVSIEAQRPDGSTVSWAGSVFEVTKVRVVLPAGALTIAGDWKLQPLVVIPPGAWRGKTVKMRVYRVFE